MGETTILDQVGTTLHLVRVTPSQMRVLQQAGTHHVPFVQHPDRPNKPLLENHLQKAAAAAGQPQPTDGEVRDAYPLFWDTHRQPLPPSPPKRNQAHHRSPEHVGYVPHSTIPAVLLLAPNSPQVTLRRSKAQGNLWMLPTPTALKFHPPPLPQQPLMGKRTICWKRAPQAMTTPWPILQPLARYHHARTAHTTPEQHGWLHTHLDPAPADVLATVAGGLDATAELRIHRGTLNTKQPAITYLVIAKHRSPTPKPPRTP